jgi:hypothetical protein
VTHDQNIAFLKTMKLTQGLKRWSLDVLIQNFRPGVMEKLRFHYEALQPINARLVYGDITRYGREGLAR